MKIEMPESGKIKILLDMEDMKALDISFEEMDYSNIETRRVIWTLLDEARRELNADIDPSGRMLIEVAPSEGGGCIMYFTVLAPEPSARPRRLLMKKPLKPVVYEFDSVDSLLSIGDGVKFLSADRPKSELYILGGKYRLIIYPSDPNGALTTVISEYGTCSGEGLIAAAYTREHWSLLSEGNALDNICCRCK